MLGGGGFDVAQFGFCFCVHVNVYASEKFSQYSGSGLDVDLMVFTLN